MPRMPTVLHANRDQFFILKKEPLKVNPQRRKPIRIYEFTFIERWSGFAFSNYRLLYISSWIKLNSIFIDEHFNLSSSWQIWRMWMERAIFIPYFERRRRKAYVRWLMYRAGVNRLRQKHASVVSHPLHHPTSMSAWQDVPVFIGSNKNKSLKLVRKFHSLLKSNYMYTEACTYL